MFRSLARASNDETEEQFQNASSVPQNQLTFQQATTGIITFDPNTRQPHKRETSLTAFASGLQLSQELRDAQDRCKVAVLDDLINTQDASQAVRCGWIYSKGTPGTQPKVSAGALGTQKGPIASFQNPKGTWFWNLEDAKKAILRDRCAELKNCGSVGGSQFQGCAFSTTRGFGVPVKPDGTLMYPNDPSLSAPVASLVTTPDKCAVSTAAGSGTPIDLQRSRDLCKPLPNGKLSRDCMLQQVVAAGCKQDGSLYQALVNQATPTNYGAGLMDTLAYRRYQQLATNPSLEGAIRDGNTTVNLALGNFKRLEEASKNVQESVLSYAARDLCVAKGTIDKFDFCLELNDNSRAPFAVECLQKEFTKGGGRPAGREYPTAVNKAQWDALGRWSAVKGKITSLAAQTRSTNSLVQRTAITNFLGTQSLPPLFQQIARIPGMELLWFNRGTNTFLGRRVGLPNANFNVPNASTDMRNFMEYILITNVRPPTNTSVRLRTDADNSVVFPLNRDTESVIAVNRKFDTAPAVTATAQGTCYTLTAGGPNYVMGLWQEAGNVARARLTTSACSGGAVTPMSNDWLTLVQEQKAPMFSWQGFRTLQGQLGFNERRMPTAMGMTVSPKTTVVAQTAATGVGNVDAMLQLKQNGNGFGVIGRNIALDSLRSLTVLFSTNGRVADGRIVDFGPLQLNIVGGKFVASWSSATLRTDTTKQQLTWTVAPSGRVYYYACVTMRSDNRTQFPNRLSVAFAPPSEFLAGRVSITSQSANVASFTTTGGAPLYNATDSALLALGDRNTRATADVNVAFVRMFDYELNDTDIARDIGNNWLMRYMM
jgi:hypothetical protein